PRLALRRALPAHHIQFPPDSSDAILHAATICFQLCFAFTAAHADPAFLTRQVAPETSQSRQKMLQLGQLNLELAFAGASALRKDIKNEGRAVQDFAVENFLEVAALR